MPVSCGCSGRSAAGPAADDPGVSDDAKREYAYGPANGPVDTKFDTFPLSLMEKAKQQGWVVISTKNDWKTVFSLFVMNQIAH